MIVLFAAPVWGWMARAALRNTKQYRCCISAILRASPNITGVA
jgi:hypothetical protein